MMIPERKLDYIIAYDSSGELMPYDYVNGTTFGQSAKVAHNLGLPFPDVPDSPTFLNLGLNIYPVSFAIMATHLLLILKPQTFFGCNASVDMPLVLYLPNSPWTAYSNFSFTKPSLTNNQLDDILENSFNLVTYGNGKLGSQKDAPPFSACIACGLIDRSLRRSGQPLPSQCQACFEQHCWNGTVQSTPAMPLFDPFPLLNTTLSYAEWEKEVWLA